jgi:aryl-alcohol dehydrogenase-like predicted oxidoreductase
LFREPERDVLTVCRYLGFVLVTFITLWRGFLSGALKDTAALASDDLRRRLPRFQGANFDRNLTLVQRLEAMARRKQCTPAQLALAWLLARGIDIVPIPGTKRQKYVEENAAAASIDLIQADMSELEAMFAPSAVAGDRYNESMARLIDTARRTYRRTSTRRRRGRPFLSAVARSAKAEGRPWISHLPWR